MIIIVMGVSGSGKSTIGRMLAEKLAFDFLDADDFHSTENVDKMRQGIALDDNDRYTWLQTLNQQLLENKHRRTVLACSALKEKYRSILTNSIDDVKWVFLKGTEAVIRKRIEERSQHYMNASLLRSQFEALEEPTYGIHIDVSKPPVEIIDEIINRIS